MQSRARTLLAKLEVRMSLVETKSTPSSGLAIHSSKRALEDSIDSRGMVFLFEEIVITELVELVFVSCYWTKKHYTSTHDTSTNTNFT